MGTSTTDPEELKACEALFTTSIRVSGSILDIWANFQEPEQIVVYDTNIRAPASTFFAYMMLDARVNVQFHSVIIMPRQVVVAEDALRVSSLLNAKKKFKVSCWGFFWFLNLVF